jgi:3-hydroxyisobutyrate dehydrogenase
MSADAIKRVCFVGIGNMGWPMAARLVRAGLEVAVTDAVAGRAKAFVDQVGGEAVANLADATTEADVLVTMLPTSAHVVSVVDEIRPSLSSGKILVDMRSAGGHSENRWRSRGHRSFGGRCACQRRRVARRHR